MGYRAPHRKGSAGRRSCGCGVGLRLRKILDPSDPFGDIGHVDAWSTRDRQTFVTQTASRV